MRITATITALLCLLLLGLSGCSEDELGPVSEPPTCVFEGGHGIDPLTDVFEAMVVEDLAEALDADFRFVPLATDVVELELPRDHFTRADFLTSVGNMFSGESIVNLRGLPVPAVGSIDMPQPMIVGEWETAGPESLFPGSLTALYWVGLTIMRPNAYALAISGQYRFYLDLDDADPADLCYRLVGWQELPMVKSASEDFSLGEALHMYLNTEPPTASFTVEVLQQSETTTVRLDAGGSSDPEGDLHAEPYRWRIENGPYTAWSNNPVHEYTFSSAGEKAIGLEVRDIWSVADTSSTTYEVVTEVPWPSSAFQAMVNFRTVYECKATSLVPDLLDGDFRLVLKEDTVQGFGLPESFFDHEEELAIHQNLFSGEPVGLEPGTSGITFPVWERLSAWTISPFDDPNFPDTAYASYNVKIELERAGRSTLIVQGILKAYLSSEVRDDDGTPRDYFFLVGLVDLTQSFAARANEGASFGTVHALYQ